MAAPQPRPAPRCPRPPLPLGFSAPWLCPSGSGVFAGFLVASLHSHLLCLPGFPSCNLRRLSPPPPGLRDTKGFTHPQRPRPRHRQTDQ